MTNGSLSCSRSASRSARRQRSAAPRAVAAVVAEPGVGQRTLAGVPGRAPRCGPPARVRARAVRCCRPRPPATRARARPPPPASCRARPARPRRARPVMSPAAAYARDSSQAQPLVEPGRDSPPGPCPGYHLRGHFAASLGQPAARRQQAGHRPDQLVRAGGQGGVQLPEPAARLAQLTPFQVHPGERGERRRVRVRGRRPLLVGGQGRCRLAGQFRGAAQPAAQGLHQRELPEAAGPLVLPARCGRGGHTRIEDAGRLVETARPQLDGPAAGQHARPDGAGAGPARPASC